LNGQSFKGRPLAVSEARARDEAPGPRPSYTPSSPGSFAGPPAPGGPPGGRPQRNFGPPAPPRRPGKGPAKRGGKGETRPKGPIKLKAGGRLYGMDDDVNDEVTDDFDNLAESTDEQVDDEGQE
jgi:hypothetical protein